MDFVSMPVKKMNYEDVLALPGLKHQKPVRGFRLIRYLGSKFLLKDLNKENFSYILKSGIQKLNTKEPAIYLMNHSSAVDLEVFTKLFNNKMFYLVGTHDGFIGRKFILRYVCAAIPAKKYVTELNLIDDISYAAKKFKKPIVIFPEASWCLGGVNAILPDSLGGMLKYFKLPVYVVKTFGAYQKSPQYNNAHNKDEMRNVNIHSEVELMFTKENLSSLNPKEINDKLKDIFTYDHFRWQYENHVKVDEKFRAKGLHHVLYKCPHCKTEGQMDSEEITVKCKHCGKEYELTEYGKLKANGFKGAFEFVSDWYYWEEQCVIDDIRNNKYNCKSKVDIYVAKDTKSFYDIGDGYLSQDKTGIKITDLDGNLIYEHLHKSSYSLYADFHFYGSGDIISVGNNDIQYYCFTNYEDFPVLKARFAAEEAYRLFKKGEN